MKLKLLLSYFIDFIDLFYLYKEHKVTHGLDHWILGLFFGLLFGPFYPGGWGGGRPLVHRKGW